jgi:beta-mannosidase
MLGLPAERSTNPLFSEWLPALVESLAPGVAWLPSTPTGGALPFHADRGVTHYYGVGAYRRPLDDARRAGVRFAAECLAFSNIPDSAMVGRLLGEARSPGQHLNWKPRVPRDAGADWDFEDVRDHYVERLFGVETAGLRADDPERYLALGRVATGEVMLRTFAEWRRPGSSCRGGLVWFARDLWPCAGWGVIDSDGRPKTAYWYLKRVLAPVALLAADEGLNGLWFHAVNDTPHPIDAELRVARYGGGCMRGVSVSTALTIPARGARSVHADPLFEGFVDLTYAYRFGPPEHDVVAATLMAFPAACRRRKRPLSASLPTPSRSRAGTRSSSAPTASHTPSRSKRKGSFQTTITCTSSPESRDGSFCAPKHRIGHCAGACPH